MSENGPARTMFASKALQIHELFAARFNEVRVGQKLLRKVEVQTVDVETTGGGQLARMAISLVPDDGKAGPSLVCGWIDVGKNRVRLRSHATLSQMFKAQTSHFFDLPAAEYDVFVEEARIFVTGNGYHFEVYDEESRYTGADQAAKAPAALQTSSSPTWLLLAAIALALAVAAFVLISR